MAGVGDAVCIGTGQMRMSGTAVRSSLQLGALCNVLHDFTRISGIAQNHFEGDGRNTCKHALTSMSSLAPLVIPALGGDVSDERQLSSA